MQRSKSFSLCKRDDGMGFTTLNIMTPQEEDTFDLDSWFTSDG